MKFDFTNFESELQKFKTDKPNSCNKGKGISRVVEHVWMHSPTKDIDFNAFTLEDIKTVYNEMGELPLYFQEGGEIFECDPDNLFMVCDRLTDLCFDMTNLENKRYELDEEDLFI